VKIVFGSFFHRGKSSARLERPYPETKRKILALQHGVAAEKEEPTRSHCKRVNTCTNYIVTLFRLVKCVCASNQSLLLGSCYSMEAVGPQKQAKRILPTDSAGFLVQSVQLLFDFL